MPDCKSSVYRILVPPEMMASLDQIEHPTLLNWYLPQL
jgi:hypothetical protein